MGSGRQTTPVDRRRVLVGAGSMVGLGLAGATAWAAAAPKKEKEKAKADEDVGPGEDLMREHGVLRRVLLVYAEMVRRIEAGTTFDAGTLRESAGIIRTFIEDYHEKQEEEFLFPRFERAGKLVDLVHVLRAQHAAGRKVTARIQTMATQSTLADPEVRRVLRNELLAFRRMYEPHAAREDTVLFPALHEIVSPHEYDALGEDFERREHQLFGEDGFEHAVARIADVEKTLGIEDLAQFTPKA
ncbi:MAG TPA: hemerythrin domain-containing protein [Polyangia bacterium]|jgi:hemerythrin-like domain-containing protein|nr:hemerythrin domain-containing protein [Polyangia bacterium]